MLRPDLVLKKGKDFLFIDATIPFENGLEALILARKEKEKKYNDIAQELCKSGFNVGSLGAWDPKNDRLLRRICSQKYLKMMRKIMVSETISDSRDIYYEHLNIVPQDSGGRRF